MYKKHAHVRTRNKGPPFSLGMCFNAFDRPSLTFEIVMPVWTAMQTSATFKINIYYSNPCLNLWTVHRMIIIKSYNTSLNLQK